MPKYKPYHPKDEKGRTTGSKSTRKATYLYNKYEAPRLLREERAARKKQLAEAQVATPANETATK